MQFDFWVFFKNVLRKFKFHWTRIRLEVTSHEDRYTFFITSRSFLLRIRNLSDKSCRENQNTHFVFSDFFFRKSCRLWDNVEEYGRAGQATDDGMSHARCMLDTQGYKYTLRICNAYCFSTATMVAWTRLIVTLYVHCLSVRLFIAKSL
jgi:hypothetical protein